jgi:hypothetical protein
LLKAVHATAQADDVAFAFAAQSQSEQYYVNIGEVGVKVRSNYVDLFALKVKIGN